MKLNATLCQVLYEHGLVEGQRVQLKMTPPPIIPDFLGGHGRKVVFMVNNTAYKYISDEEMAMLNLLLPACNLSMDDIALINYARFENIRYTDLVSGLQSKTIIVFGVESNRFGLPFAIPNFQVQAFGEQTYLFNPSLEKFLNNRELKGSLWGCLQKIFLSK